jgi:outer membrane biogenesis lipoprotein LolB
MNPGDFTDKACDQTAVTGEHILKRHLEVTMRTESIMAALTAAHIPMSRLTQWVLAALTEHLDFVLTESENEGCED